MFSECFLLLLVFFSASSKHCASPGAVCQTRRVKWRECLHVCQVGDLSRRSEEHQQVSDWGWRWCFCFIVYRCKKKVPATKRFTVHRTSNVLTLSLKRFANFSGGKITKVHISHVGLVWKSPYISHRVEWLHRMFFYFFFQDVGYPEFLNIRPYMSQSSGDPVMYGLYAVLVHSGYSCHAGHYYCYVKVSLHSIFMDKKI